MDNMEIYNRVWETAPEAKKPIKGGRLNGFTDIKPMSRIKKLTEVFGPCGIGWKYEVTSQRIEFTETGEAKAFVDINLYYKWNGEWSAPIPGIGGNAFISTEKGGKYVNDECFKSALSDAIGTACKALGMNADVYWAEDRTKYDRLDQDTEPKQKPRMIAVCEDCGGEITGYTAKNGVALSPADAAATSKRIYGRCLCLGCMKKIANAES